jgi:hypothetical protein
VALKDTLQGDVLGEAEAVPLPRELLFLRNCAWDCPTFAKEANVGHPTSRGILVTTSVYGADAYAFANNEPITLLNGAELLGLLRKHGYKFRINLEEARRFNQASALGRAAVSET